jgi:hypothetical protein
LLEGREGRLRMLDLECVDCPEAFRGREVAILGGRCRRLNAIFPKIIIDEFVVGVRGYAGVVVEHYVLFSLGFQAMVRLFRVLKVGDR